MSFWGVEVKPGKPYTFSSEDTGGKLVLTQATLGLGSSTNKSVLQCNVGDKSPVLLCSLLPNRNECCPLNLGAFNEDAAVKFSVIGPTSIHISGYVEDQDQDFDEDDSEFDSYGEDIAETESDDSSVYVSDDFIDDEDMEMYGHPAARKSGVVIKEIEDDEIPAIENSLRKTKKKKNLDKDKDSQQQIAVKGGTEALLESEDEDGFPISAKENLSKTFSEAKKKNKNELQAKDDNNPVKNLKRKGDSVVHDQEPERGVAENSLWPAGSIPEENVKQNKKKKNQGAEGKADGSKSDAIAEDRAESKENNCAVADKTESDEKPENENVQNVNGDISEVKKNKKKKEKKKNLDGEGVSNGEVIITDAAENKLSTAEDKTKKSKVKTSHVRTFSNGLVVEELEMGKPDGKRASSGNKVGVHYVGKLKNGKIFDSNIGRAPFKFRLGIGQVIKGWDVGIEGMRIGDKRRLTVPPSMAYGVRGCPPQIPPNSWLVFDVTLANVS